MAEQKFQIELKNFYSGYSPEWATNSLTEYGNSGHASVMTNCDVLSHSFLTQGPALTTLTDATVAVTELISFIMDKATASGVS
jgi:hypothetical protein